MMSIELSTQAFDRAATGESDLLECLRQIGKGLIASGSAVGVVENTLTEIALGYEIGCEIVALPNVPSQVCPGSHDCRLTSREEDRS